MDNGYQLFWGDTHTNLHSRHLEDLETTLRYAQELLDFWPIAYYPQDPRTVRGFWYGTGWERSESSASGKSSVTSPLRTTSRESSSPSLATSGREMADGVTTMSSTSTTTSR